MIRSNMDKVWPYPEYAGDPRVRSNEWVGGIQGQQAATDIVIDVRFLTERGRVLRAEVIA